ncbi:MAG: ABC transporter permease [Cyclobacteriaceae bacterium]
MLRNYYLTAVRNLIKQKSYFLLNLFGLAIGITSFIFVSLFVLNELSYDRFHSKADNIYRVHVFGNMMGQKLDMAATAAPMAQAMLADYPEVEKVTRVKESGAWFIGQGQKKFNEDGVLFSDSTFFQIFDFDWIAGDPANALTKPRSMVITRTYAEKYFGDEPAFGKRVSVEQDTVFYEITGVIEDVPDNSHIQFDMMCSRSTYPFWDNNQWVSHNDLTYVLLKENADSKAFESKLDQIVKKFVGPQISQFLGTSMEDWENAGNSFGYYLMPLTNIHLYSNVESELEANSDISYVYIYSLIAFILLFIAIINFVNLATAQSAARAKEVGIRKVMGSNKQSLITQFIFESILVAFIATLIAASLVVFLTPQFESLVGKELSIGITDSLVNLLILLGLSVLIGVLAGFYPAIVLASFQPTDILKGKLKSGAKSGVLRNLLVISQFVASIVIIVGTMAVYNQIDFMLNKNLGFKKDQILVIRRPDVLQKNLETFKNDARNMPSVIEVANANSIPGKSRYSNNAKSKMDNPDEPYLVQENWVSFEYAEVMGLELVEGRFFSKEYGTDSSAVVINETAAKVLGWDEPLKEAFADQNRNGEITKQKVIGVVKDYYIKSLHNAMEPVVLHIMPGNSEGYLAVKLDRNANARETINELESTWYKYSYNKPFQYFFFDEDYADLYKSESQTGDIFVVFAGLSIFIACLGLIGLITFTTSVRRKEIGIRKVMGAGTWTLVSLLSKEFVKLIGFATLVAWPLAYFGVNYWLENFADRLSISPWFFVISTLVVVIMGAMAISFQTIKTSMMNPVTSLRNE